MCGTVLGLFSIGGEGHTCKYLYTYLQVQLHARLRGHTLPQELFPTQLLAGGRQLILFITVLNPGKV